VSFATFNAGHIMVGTVKFEARIKECLVESFPDLMALVEPLLVVRRVLREQIAILAKGPSGGLHTSAD
jgi:hypothetical protein